MAGADRDQTLTHLGLIASSPGVWELRALQRLDGARMEARSSFFIIATAMPEGLIYDRFEQVVEWADEQARRGAEIFAGMNPRSSETTETDAVSEVTSCYVDLDLPEGLERDDALARITEGDNPLPSFIVNSGYGLHIVYLLREPSRDKVTWWKVQRALCRRFADLGADCTMAPDESRVLHLVPYSNRKRRPDGLPTSLFYISDNRHELATLAHAVGLTLGTASSRREAPAPRPQPSPVDNGDGAASATLPDADEMDELIERSERTRAAFSQWIMRNMKLGLHFDTYPAAGQDASKPTLLKPGAEQVALLYGWRFVFTADLDSLHMYGSSLAGVFAYICTVIDSDGRTVGQGRGVAELRETGMINANTTVKIAEKRAMVDAVLRCAGLSQWFTQDVEDLRPWTRKPRPCRRVSPYRRAGRIGSGDTLRAVGVTRRSAPRSGTGFSA